MRGVVYVIVETRLDHDCTRSKQSISQVVKTTLQDLNDRGTLVIQPLQ